MPRGRVWRSRSNSASRASPRCRMSPPGFIDTARPRASCSMKRMRGALGALKPRETSAISPMWKVGSPDRRGQGLAQPIELGLQGIAQLQDVAPGFHRYRQAQGILLHEAHARGHGVVEAAEDVGDILDMEGAVTDPQGEAADLLDAAELTGDPQTYPLIRGLEEAGLAQIVLLLQCLLHCRHRQAQGSQPRVGYLDPDLLVLHADQLDLADVADALQLQLQALGIVLEHGVVEAFTGQRIDVAESGAELVVVEGTDDIRRQGMADIADLLAQLVPELRNLPGRQVVPGDEGDGGLPRA